MKDAPSGLYRPNVAAIIIRGDGRILIAERISSTDAWQFPQGGVSKGESPLTALHREVEEEVGLKPDQYEILKERSGYRYTFPSGKLKKGKFNGQDQTYYLCRTLESNPSIDISGPPQEFRRAAWIYPHQFDITWLPKFKREVYQAVLCDFFELEKW